MPRWDYGNGSRQGGEGASIWTHSGPFGTASFSRSSRATLPFKGHIGFSVSSGHPDCKYSLSRGNWFKYRFFTPLFTSSLLLAAMETRDTDNGIKYSNCPLWIRFRHSAVVPHHCPFQGKFSHSSGGRLFIPQMHEKRSLNPFHINPRTDRKLGQWRIKIGHVLDDDAKVFGGSTWRSGGGIKGRHCQVFFNYYSPSSPGLLLMEHSFVTQLIGRFGHTEDRVPPSYTSWWHLLCSFPDCCWSLKWSRRDYCPKVSELNFLWWLADESNGGCDLCAFVSLIDAINFLRWHSTTSGWKRGSSGMSFVVLVHWICD